MEILGGGSMCPFIGVLVSWWRDGGNGSEELNLSGSVDTFIELKNQVSVEGVIRISSDADLIFQCV